MPVMLAAPQLLTPRQGANPLFILIIWVVAFFAIFYFLVLRPERMKARKHQEMLDAVTKGDEIVTAGGIIGKVIHAADDRLTIRTADTTRLVVERGRVARVITGNEEGDARDDSKAS